MPDVYMKNMSDFIGTIVGISDKKGLINSKAYSIVDSSSYSVKLDQNESAFDWVECSPGQLFEARGGDIVLTIDTSLQAHAEAALQQAIEKSGAEGGKSPLVSTPCECHYAGTLTDGTEFDSSYKRGQPATFAPNQVVKGWTEAMQLMGEGDKWMLYLPSELACAQPPRLPSVCCAFS